MNCVPCFNYRLPIITYFLNLSEIYYKKMFAYFEVALGQSGSGNIGVLCLDGYDTMRISNLYEQINIMIS